MDRLKINIKKIFNLILLGLTGLLLFICLAVSFPRLFDDKNYAIGNSWIRVLTVIVGVVVFISFLMVLFKLIDKLKKRSLNIISILLFTVFVIIATVFIINFQSIPMTDSYRCVDMAAAFTTGELGSISCNNIYYNYFSNYSNNNMFVMTLTLLFKFVSLFGVTDFLLVGIIFNALSIFISIVIIFFTVKTLFGLKKAVKTLLICVLNPIFYSMIPWIYTISMSLPHISLILYLCVLIYKCETNKKRVILSAVLGAFSAYAFLFRVTSIFPVLAFLYIIIINIKFNRQSIKRILLTFFTFVIMFSIVFVPLKMYSNSNFEKTLENNFPITHWIMMGVHNNGKYNYQDSSFTASFKTYDEKKNANIKEIKKAIASYSVIDFVSHAINKIGITWSDPKCGYLSRLQQNREYSGLYNLIAGSDNFIFLLYCQIVRLTTFIFVLISIIKQMRIKNKDKQSKLIPITITLLGAMIFYIIWECKAAYSVPFMPVMMILYTSGLDYFISKTRYKSSLSKRRLTEKIFTAIMSVLLIITVFISILAYPAITQVSRKKDDVAVCNTNFSREKIVSDISKNNRILEQDFYTDKAFNKITIFANRVDQKNIMGYNKITKYYILLLDENQKKLMYKRVTAVKVKKGKIHLRFKNDIVPAKREKFTIKIFTLNNSYDTIGFRLSNGYCVPVINGNLMIDSDACHDNAIGLKFKAQRKYTAPILSENSFIIFAVFVILIEALILVSMIISLRNTKKRDKEILNHILPELIIEEQQ